VSITGNERVENAQNPITGSVQAVREVSSLSMIKPDAFMYQCAQRAVKAWLALVKRGYVPAGKKVAARAGFEQSDILKRKDFLAAAF